MSHPEKFSAGARIRPRLYLAGGVSLAPGKVDLLRRVGECGSISRAARAMGIPYKRAWMLIDTLKGLPQPVLVTAQRWQTGWRDTANRLRRGPRGSL